MDFDQFGMVGGSLGIISIIVGIILKLNHTRFRSHCCGRNMEASIDIEPNTSGASPKKTEDKKIEKIVIQN